MTSLRRSRRDLAASGAHARTISPSITAFIFFVDFLCVFSEHPDGLGIPNTVCDVRKSPYSAAGDNHTDDTRAIQQAIDECGTVVLSGKGSTYRITSSLALRSDVTIYLSDKASIFSAQPLCYPHAESNQVEGSAAIEPHPDSSSSLKDYPACKQNPRCPTNHWPKGPTAIICGTNLSNVAIIGQGASSNIIDGGGWPWYSAARQSDQMWGVGPRGFELEWSQNITLSGIGFHNIPSWTVHPTFCNDVTAEFIEIRNPRFTHNTDGFDPESCTNVVLRDSYIDTGDDGISIKSGNSTVKGSEHVMVPAKNIHIYRTKILSRNVCIGSATFGGIYDVVIEDCEIGDLHGSSPWAIKYKSHQSYPGPMRNHTWRRLKVGKIQSNSYQQPNAGYFMSIELRYHPLIPNRVCHEWDCPVFDGISFEDISVAGAEMAGDIYGLPGSKLRHLSFRNVSFQTKPVKSSWKCGLVNLKTFTSTNVNPPLKCSRD